MSTKVAGLVIQVEAWAREELGQQRELARLLERQEGAVSENDTTALVETSELIQRQLRSGTGRDRRRRQILERLAAELGVAPGTLTLSSIAARAAERGLPVDGLRALQAELREESARVLRRGRRLAAVARNHRAFLDEVLRILAPQGAAGDARGDQPVLLDARG